MALTVRPDLPEALLGLGMTRFALKDFPGAIASLDTALKARPIFPEAKYARARSRFELGQHQEALNDLVDLPASFDVYARSCSTGLAFSALGFSALTARDDPRAMELYREAEKAFNEALKVRPGDKSAKLGADQSRQNALDNFLGSGVREALRRLPACGQAAYDIAVGDPRLCGRLQEELRRAQGASPNASRAEDKASANPVASVRTHSGSQAFSPTTASTPSGSTLVIAAAGGREATTRPSRPKESCAPPNSWSPERQSTRTREIS